jgi:inosine/xanthosine triphosphate pyrophosphatase family protein
VLALILPDGMHISQAKVKGIIPLKPSISRTEGFPYRSLLYVPEMGKFYDDTVMTPMETDAYNHRKRAVTELMPLIRLYADTSDKD